VKHGLPEVLDYKVHMCLLVVASILNVLSCRCKVEDVKHLYESKALDENVFIGDKIGKVTN